MLNDEQVSKVRQVLMLSGWNEVMRPALVQRGHEAIKALVLTRAERSATYKGTAYDSDDDVLRAIIRDCEWMTVCWTNEIAASEHNRRLDELDRQTNGTATPNG